MIDFEKALREAFNSINKPQSKQFFEAIEYALFSGGKRVRPTLMLLTAEMLDVNIDKVLPYAIAVECIHTYSLIHDDLPAMDNDSLRRNKPTVHIKFGEDIAILAGDALLNLAYEVILNSKDINAEALKELLSASGMYGMVGGQALEIEVNKNKDSYNDNEMLNLLNQINLGKTGALFRICLTIPFYLSDKEARIGIILNQIAKKINEIFQLVDDIMDYEKDLKEKRATTATILGLKEANKLKIRLNDYEELFLSLNLPYLPLFEYCKLLTHRII